MCIRDRFREAIQRMEHSWPRILTAGGPTSINTTGTFPQPLVHGPTPTNRDSSGHSTNHTSITDGPHENIYQQLQELEQSATELVPGNKHIRRMFSRCSFPIYYRHDHSLQIDPEKLGAIKFVAVSSGRSHFLALDDNNELYSWDTAESEHGIKILFDDLPLKETNPIVKIACGWDFNCVYIYDIGLVVWKERDALQEGELASNAHCMVVPKSGDTGGENKVLDFACTQNNCVYFITNKGDKLYSYNLGLVESVDLPPMLDGKLEKIVACFSCLVLFTDHNCYTVGLRDSNIDMDSFSQLVLDDPEDHIISLKGGDYHVVALTKKGQIYTWGIESQFSGCLGLGRPQHVVDEVHLGTWNGPRNVKVLKPTKVPLDDKYVCLAVAAGGWQSGAIIMKK